MGVYERKVIDRVGGWPVVESKLDSIEQEIMWTRDYCHAAGGVPVLFPELRDDTGTIQNHFDRDNLVLENEFFRKWKGTWQ